LKFVTHLKSTVELIQLNIVTSWQFFHHDCFRTAFVLSRLCFYVVHIFK